MKYGKNVSISLVTFSVILLALISSSYFIVNKSLNLFTQDKLAYVVDSEIQKIKNIRQRIFDLQNLKYHEHSQDIAKVISKESGISKEIMCIFTRSGEYSYKSTTHPICDNFNLEDGQEIEIVIHGSDYYVLERHILENSSPIYLIYDLKMLFGLIDNGDSFNLKVSPLVNNEAVAKLENKNIISSIGLTKNIVLVVKSKNIVEGIPNYFIKELILVSLLSGIVVFVFSITISSIFTVPLRKISTFAHNLNLEDPVVFPIRNSFIREVKLLYDTLHGLTDKLISKNRELHFYNLNLEKIVKQRTLELENINAFQALMMNSLSQGMFTINPDGVCGNIFNNNCEVFFNQKPVGKDFVDFINSEFPNSLNRDMFDRWLNLIFKIESDFESCASLLINELNSLNGSSGKVFRLEYYLIENLGIREAVLILVTDQTESVKNKIKLDKQLLISSKLISFFKYNESYDNSMIDIKNLFASIVSKEEINSGTLGSIHTLKGLLLAWGYSDISEELHHIEGLIKNGDLVTNIRLKDLEVKFIQGLEEIDELIQNKKNKARGEWDEKTLHDIKSNIFENPLIAYSLIEKISSTSNFKNYLSPILDEVQNVANKINKKVKIDLSEIADGFNISRDQEFRLRSIIHLLKNSVIHGIESPEERIEKNKDEVGLLKIRAYVDSENSYSFIEIIDDGRGIDFENIRQKYGLGNISESEIKQMILSGNVTTSKIVDINSGRGVGVSSVFNSIREMDGTIEIETERNVGTRWLIVIPNLMEIASEKNLISKT